MKLTIGDDMSRKSMFLLSLVTCLLALAGCGADPALVSIEITPSTGAQVLNAVGQTAQFKAVGTFQERRHPPTTRDITNEVQWQSSAPAVATIDSTGLATAVGNGTTIITASMTVAGSLKTGTSNLQVAFSGGTPHDLTALTVIPETQTFLNSNETAQFIAIGTFTGTPTTMDMTNQVTWRSSDVGVATINSAGLATSGTIPGTTNITATATSSSGATIVGSSVLNVQAPGGGGQLPSLTVYFVGLGTGTVTSDLPGINCTSGAGCTANYQLNATVQLTAVPAPGSTFGGWSSNCTPADQPTCTLTMSNNESVGVIFNH